MPITRLTVLAALVSTMCVSGPLLAATTDAQVAAKVSAPLLSQLPVFNPAPMLAQATIPAQAFLAAPVSAAAPAAAPAAAAAALTVDAKSPAAEDAAKPVLDTSSPAVAEAMGLREALIAVAMKLRNIRYVRGGRDPSTGFDCSGFVRYVFERSIGLELPTNSASQFNVGHKISRDNMQPGDLVFFRTAGGRRGQGRVSHVGIYLSDGQFIHSPRRGESVRVDNLADAYWSKRFAGAKRPDAMAQIDAGHNG